LRAVVPPLAKFALSLPPPQGDAADSFWVSLRYFNYYRIAVAAVFLFAVPRYGTDLSLGDHDPAVFIYASGAYLALALLFMLCSEGSRDISIFS